MKPELRSVQIEEFGLRIDSPLSVPAAANFRPPSWPPPDDWPVVIDAYGEVVSYYGDHIWRLDPWAGRPLMLNFGDSPRKTLSDPLDPENARLLRLVTAFWIFGPSAARSSSTVKALFTYVRKIFALCAREGICVSDLSHFPLVAEKIPPLLTTARVNIDWTFNALHDLYENRELLGFVLLDREGLRHLQASLPYGLPPNQRAYIPPRIWSYQVARLRECLEDFVKHKDLISDCYQFCLDAYGHNAGSLAEAVSGGFHPDRAPFRRVRHSEQEPGLKFYGPFEITAAIFDIHELLEKWNGPLNDGTADSGVLGLTDYLSLVSFAGLAYILNFSLMRIHEAWGLRADCLLIEQDEKLGDICVLRGETSKTQKDSDAHWPSSPSVKVAIEALTHIAHLRLRCTSTHKRFSKFEEDVNNPFLFARCYEPWLSVRDFGLNARLQHRSYKNCLISKHPLLFDQDVIKISKEDLELARLITPTLDCQKFSVGKPWPFSWHQLRRTGSVNMQASGVSGLSLQYLLKHATLPMSLYYGRNHTRLRLNEEARTCYLRAMYEVIGIELSRLSDQRYMSPHGEKRKTDLLQPILSKDAATLAKAAKNGEVPAPREIILGYCMNRDVCPWGGLDSIAHCGGGDSDAPCLHVLYDQKKINVVKRLDDWLDQQLHNAPIDSPLRQSLQFQKKSARNYLDAAKTSK